MFIINSGKIRYAEIIDLCSQFHLLIFSCSVSTDSWLSLFRSRITSHLSCSIFFNLKISCSTENSAYIIIIFYSWENLQGRVLACLVSCNVFLLTAPLHHSPLFCNFHMQTFFHTIFINGKML